MEQVTLYSSEFFHDRNLKLELIERDPQIPYPLHTHDFSELVIVLGGYGTHFTYDDQYQVYPGDVFYIEPGFAHGYKDTKKLHLYNILFDPSILEQSFVDIRNMPGYHSIFHIEPKYRESHRFETRLRLTSDQIVAVAQLVDKIKEELEQSSHEQGNRAMALAYFIELMVSLSRYYGSREDREDAGDHEIHRLARVLSYMEQNRGKQISLQELADHAYMSYSTLNRAFHQAVGCSPLEYHQKLRIKDACRRLETSPLPITEIAYQCGFGDSNYFSRQFKKLLGMTPRSYRKSRSR